QAADGRPQTAGRRRQAADGRPQTAGRRHYYRPSHYRYVARSVFIAAFGIEKALAGMEGSDPGGLGEVHSVEDLMIEWAGPSRDMKGLADGNNHISCYDERRVIS
ncbi:MAG: hypothetical protein KFH87_12265, partial [Bacteroidetes bacterium]|nr:hypothetical protein [Bacteroidota bacterium]